MGWLERRTAYRDSPRRGGVPMSKQNGAAMTDEHMIGYETISGPKPRKYCVDAQTLA
jgi:hypothetical protein